MINNNEWLKNIKIGDIVKIKCVYFKNGYELDIVSRVTKTQIILNGRDIRFRLKDGISIGDHNIFNGGYLIPCN